MLIFYKYEFCKLWVLQITMTTYQVLQIINLSNSLLKKWKKKKFFDFFLCSIFILLRQLRIDHLKVLLGIRHRLGSVMFWVQVSLFTQNKRKTLHNKNCAKNHKVMSFIGINVQKHMYKQEHNSSKRAKNTTPSFFRKINVKKGVLLLSLTVKAEKFFKQISLLHLITTHAWKTIKRLKNIFC